MIYAVDISNEAKFDLRSIYEHIAFELLSPENAAEQIRRLRKNILSLNEMPKRFRLYEKEPWKSRGLRMLPVDNYIVFYIPNDDKTMVTITRVMYSGRDIDNELNK